MFFSKKGAKVLAAIMIFAFLLTGMSYAPAKVQAASDQAPTVKVLGATLRLDGDSGKQSLRLGIEISNASNAEACGINITYNDKTVTIGTDVQNSATSKNNPYVYSKDEVNDKIVYTAVITGIPKDNYGNPFEVKGYVKEKVSSEKKGESTSTKKSVSNVVDTLKNAYPELNLDINEDGDLVKTLEDGTKEAVQAEDFKTDDKDINNVPNDVNALDLSSCFHANDLNKTENEDGSVKFTAKTDGGTFPGVMVKLPGSLSARNSVNITVDYSCEGESDTARLYLLNGTIDNAKSNIIGPAASPISGTLTATESADSFYIKAKNGGSSFTSLTINSIIVEAGETTAPVDAPQPGFNEDGTLYTLPINSNTFETSWYNGSNQYSFNSTYNSVKITHNGDIGIELPKDIYTSYNFSKAIITYKDSDNTDNFHFVAKYNTDGMGWSSGEEAHYDWNNTLNGEGTVEIIPNGSDAGNFSGFRLFDGTAGSTLTITSVVFVRAAPPVYKVDLENDLVLENGFVPDYEFLDDYMNISFSGLSGFYYILPENAGMENSKYKHVYISYQETSEKDENGNNQEIQPYLVNDKYNNFSRPVSSLPTDDQKTNSNIPALANVSVKTVRHLNADYSIHGIQLFGVFKTANVKLYSIIFSEEALTADEIAAVEKNGVLPDKSEIPYVVPAGFMNYNSSTAGIVEDITYDSTVIKEGETVQRKAKVVLPKDYDPNKQYPVVYMQHGIGGDENALYNDNTQNVFWNAMAGGAAKEMIAVFPNACANETGAPPKDEEGNELFFSLEHYAAYDNFLNDLEQCLMPYINENYSTLTGRENTAICGFSMGGRVSLHIGFTLQDKFGYVGGFCPAFGILEYSNYGVHEDGLFTEETFKLDDQYMDNTLVMIVAGTNDGIVRTEPKRYSDALKANSVPHIFYETMGGDSQSLGDGGHGGWVAKHGLYNFITRIFNN